jgi:hypothetical protein
LFEVVSRSRTALKLLKPRRLEEVEDELEKMKEKGLGEDAGYKSR